jgi:hypothetical protein
MLRAPDLAGGGIDHLHRLPGEVDEQPLPRRVHLPHRRRQPALPAPIEVAPTTIAVAVGLLAPVFVPQQHQRDTRPAQFAVHRHPVRLGLSPQPNLRPAAGEQQRLQRAVRQRRR